MSSRYVSPGVFTEERDFSYYASNLGESSLGLVGETKKGPAFLPVLISNMSEFVNTFGGLDSSKYVPYCAKNYFKYANSAYVVRVLGQEAVHATTEKIIYLTATGTSVSDVFVFATLLAPATLTTATLIPNIALSGGTSFGFTATTVYSSTSVNVSNPGASNNLATLFPRTNTGSTSLTLLGLWPNTLSAYKTCSAFTGSVAGSAYALSSYAQAKTPVIVSDISAGNTTPTHLFQVYSVSDGIDSNGDIKISIENVDTTARTFDLAVRSFADTDSAPIYLERFNKCSLNPTATTYLPRLIGDSRNNSGDYNRISKYIYINMSTGDLSQRVPAGFYWRVVPEAAAGITIPGGLYLQTYASTLSESKQWLGLNFATSDTDCFMKNYMSQWDTTLGSGAIKGFHCDKDAVAASYVVSTYSFSALTKAQRKFVVPVLGGRDGWPRITASRDLLGTAPSVTQLTAWKTAIDLLANPEEYDINLLAVPGCSVDSSIGTYATSMAEDRADTFYIGDFPSTQSTATGAASVTPSLDSNYAATYWPYVKIFDAENSTYVTIPPTPQVLEAIAYTDTVAYPWFAPAGMNRGLITDAVSVEYKMTLADRDILYAAKVNPIAFFPGQGIAIWGQKTLQTRTTSLDRINVRRMLLYVRKIIATSSKYLVFEQNDEKTWNRFKSMVQPILDLIKRKQGLYDFRVVMDATINTPDIIDRNELVGAIYLKPTKTAEVITLTFNILNSGAVFDE